MCVVVKVESVCGVCWSSEWRVCVVSVGCLSGECVSCLLVVRVVSVCGVCWLSEW